MRAETGEGVSKDRPFDLITGRVFRIPHRCLCGLATFDASIQKIKHGETFNLRAAISLSSRFIHRQKKDSVVISFRLQEIKDKMKNPRAEHISLGISTCHRYDQEN